MTIIGATGGRIDHLLANLWLPFEPRFQGVLRQIRLCDRQNSIQYYAPGSYIVPKEPDKEYLAYCCLTPVENLTLRRSKYLLTNQDVPYNIVCKVMNLSKKPLCLRCRDDCGYSK